MPDGRRRPDVAVHELDRVSCRVTEVHRAPAFPVDLSLDRDTGVPKGGEGFIVCAGVQRKCDVPWTRCTV